MTDPKPLRCPHCGSHDVSELQVLVYLAGAQIVASCEQCAVTFHTYRPRLEVIA